MADTLSKVERSLRMSLVRSKNTKPELIVRSLVHRLGFRFRLHVAALSLVTLACESLARLAGPRIQIDRGGYLDS